MILLTILLFVTPAAAQIDQQLAEQYFQEAETLCARDAGKLWGVSLCGPMVFADAATQSIATNQPVPDAPRPRFLGFANAAADWGGTRWSTFVWQTIPPTDRNRRARLMLHELFHRIQPELGFMIFGGQNTHLDTLEGRYWLQLEWRALAKALGTSGSERVEAVRDALAFRLTRREWFPDSIENERPDEIREGLAQYTGTVLSAGSADEAVASAIAQLKEAEQLPSFVATFAYPSGSTYGILLDESSPGWRERMQPTDDLGQLLLAAAKIEPSTNLDDAAQRYGGPELRVAEEKREAERQARIAEFRRRFVDGPVLVLPGVNSSTSITTGRTPIPGEGTMFPMFRTTAPWGSLEADWVLIPDDRSKLILPAPMNPESRPLQGDGWTLTLLPGWVLRPGTRPGDLQLVPEH